ncbi:NADH dehydrogenase [ubiquinone] 1 alpha subcomplex assembly factor 3 [Morella rubra]|uniref:NADH dehydrogenase [ubiquinone] 1 alpha subcomplex assembly factor 3 n=1 Tax=Morella rubra TaxID=262757 RepID=A0A6A1WIM7_9ROSI|nr:NADH dehydrogenase [ubiquinone] 1 alpha subcomplex assembly factor 3 [Morella rubra]
MVVRQRAVAALPNLIRSLRKESPKPMNQAVLPSLRRAFSLYDQINLIDNVPEDQLRFQRLSIFQTVRPIPEILILGCGRYIEPVGPELRRFIQSTGMKLEVLDSRNASSTYNILNEEGRIVAAALLPYGLSS